MTFPLLRIPHGFIIDRLFRDGTSLEESFSQYKITRVPEPRGQHGGSIVVRGSMGAA